ncbi:DUF1120 domain-containing protein [Pseudomonas sp. ArH3a]|uniref:DUF1120 domain-containing protein n=1 Tax=Pseudomonas sp. ArH3a TaxID=2862945 RepID=UPI001F56C78C|nr:DUF1120 domain-containing protein [Pseudomonas sp. ArH3a]UNM21141.1 DUF1120 domain-containing protein [Pseudomonas sp. ArH3a]
MQASRVPISAALLLAGVSNVMAASSVDLGVVGVITPSACTPILSNNGVVDYGKISLQEFPANEKELPDATLQLEVSCNGPMMMAVKITDNRPGTATSTNGGGDTSSFGLNLASNGQKIGRYQLKMANATADGQVGSLIESWEGSDTWLEANNAVWQPGFRRTVRDPSSAGLTPLTMTAFKVDVVVSTTLTRKQYLPSAEETKIDGSATLEVKYL